MPNKVKVIAVLDREALARRLRGEADRTPGFDTSEEPLDTALPAIKDPVLRRALKLATIH
jgi:hypothetical protein